MVLPGGLGAVPDSPSSAHGLVVLDPIQRGSGLRCTGLRGSVQSRLVKRRGTGRAYASIRWWGRERLSIEQQHRTKGALMIALWLLKNDGCSYSEIARAFGASVDTVRRYIQEQDFAMARRAGIFPRRECELLKTRLPDA